LAAEGRPQPAELVEDAAGPAWNLARSLGQAASTVRPNLNQLRRAFPLESSPTCPECGSTRVWKDGKRRVKGGPPIQRFICRTCGYRFSDPTKTSKNQHAIPIDCRVGVAGSNPASKNSAKAVQALKELERELTARPRGPSSKQELKGKLVEFAWWMKKEGYKESTITGRIQVLQRLLRLGADLYNPDSIKEVIAKQEHWSDGRKANVIYAYTLFANWLGIKWVPPKCSVEEKLPWIPLERELDDLISGCSLQISCFLQLLKESAFRAGEAFILRWQDVDFATGIITLNTPEKRSKPRQFKASIRLLSMLSNLKKQQKPEDPSERIFKYSTVSSLRRTFEKQRRRIAHKLGNPRLLRVTFHTFRHWKATIEYHKTKDILYVMKLLGHKNIKNTLKYTQLLNPKDLSEEYISKVARTIEEARRLIEAGFEYVCEMEGVKLFRKRK